MITELDKVQRKVAFWLHWLAIVVTSAVLAVLGTKDLDKSVNQLMVKLEF